MRNLRIIGSIVLWAGLFFLGACSKTEFLPDPEGSKVPYQDDVTQTVEELLAASTAKLYLQAWQKSTVKNVLKEKGDKVFYTVFVPGDAAMQAAGLNAAAIDQMPEAEIDSLIMFYTAIGAITKDDLQSKNENINVKTMLERPGLYVKWYENTGEGFYSYDHYYYRHYVGIEGGNLLINGKAVGKLNYLPATNGGVFFLEKTLEKPTKTMLEALEADGRFNMFIESQRLADERYLDKLASELESLFGYRPELEEVKRDYAPNRHYYQKDWDIQAPLYDGYKAVNLTISTLFAPTDEAFHKAGFQTVADILLFNERAAASIYYDLNTYSAVGGYPMDTVYSYHRNWGRVNQPVTPGGDKTLANATVFYSNVLNAGLNNYAVNIGGNAGIDFAYYMPLEFSLNNNKVQLKAKGSEHPAATVVDTDINTLNGPIHVVDQLLIPKGFKLK